MDRSELFSETNSIAEFYKNKANHIEWDVGKWISELPKEEKPDLSENYRSKHNLQVTGHPLSIMFSLISTMFKSWKNAGLSCMNEDAKKFKILRPLYDMTTREISILRMYETLDSIDYFGNNIYEEIKMFLAYNDGNCSFSNSGELSKYGAHSQKELLEFLKLCAIDKQGMITKAIGIINNVIQSSEVDTEISAFLKKELDISLQATS